MPRPIAKGKTPPRSLTRRKAACGECPALCCHDLVMPTRRPRTKAEADELKWHIQYEGVSAFIANGRWYLQVRGRCMYLTADNLCSMYTRRPDRCRRNNPPNCERYGDYWDVRFETPEELDAYLAHQRNARRRGLRRLSRPRSQGRGRN